MAVLKCKSCGGPLDANEGSKIVECSYCGLKQTIPQMDDEFILQMFNQANELRRQFDFDGAKSFLQAVVSRYPEDAEAYWQICLCKYGIMYVEDQLTGKQIPTFYRMIPQSILSDPDYLKAKTLAGATGWKYEEEALKIEKLQKKILELTGNETPYDIFICYKKSDVDTGRQTEDSKIAGQIYMKLLETGYRVFWSERSLPAGSEYEPYIYAALTTAKVMLILGTDKRYFDATWVKNEWVRYLDMMAKDPKKTIITCYKNIDPEDIPVKLRSLQALNMGDMLFSSDLLDRIQKKLPRHKETSNGYGSYQAEPQKPAYSYGQQDIHPNSGAYLNGPNVNQPQNNSTHQNPNRSYQQPKPTPSKPSSDVNAFAPTYDMDTKPVVVSGSTKSKIIAAFLAAFFGTYALQDFYLGYTKKGIRKILSLVLIVPAIFNWLQGWSDAIQILTGGIRTDAKGNPLR